MPVRCKFRVDSITSTTGSREKKDSNGNTVMQEKFPNSPAREDCEMRTIEMSAVYSTNPQHENKAFWEASPMGTLKLSTVNMKAAESLKLGQEYYIDITPAPPTVND